jgi:hypothetical protein
MDPRYYAKAVYAAILAALTTASALYVGNPLLTIGLAVVLAIGVYVVPNKDDREPLDTEVDLP